MVNSIIERLFSRISFFDIRLVFQCFLRLAVGVLMSNRKVDVSKSCLMNERKQYYLLECVK